MNLLDDIPANARAEIEELRQRINRANYLYYVKDQPELSDTEYDALMRCLTELEAQFPQAITPDSPTQRVGIAPQTEFATFEHRVPMLSLANAFGEDELRAFDDRCRRLLHMDSPEQLEYDCEPKLEASGSRSPTSTASSPPARRAATAPGARTSRRTSRPSGPSR